MRSPSEQTHYIPTGGCQSQSSSRINNRTRFKVPYATVHQQTQHTPERRVVVDVAVKIGKQAGRMTQISFKRNFAHDEGQVRLSASYIPAQQSQLKDNINHSRQNSSVEPPQKKWNDKAIHLVNNNKSNRWLQQDHSIVKQSIKQLARKSQPLNQSTGITQTTLNNCDTSTTNISNKRIGASVPRQASKVTNKSSPKGKTIVLAQSKQSGSKYLTEQKNKKFFLPNLNVTNSQQKPERKQIVSSGQKFYRPRPLNSNQQFRDFHDALMNKV